jgi:hypothetical protein
MRLKLDENLGRRTKLTFASAGHDVDTVTEEGLGGAADSRLFEVCGVESIHNHPIGVWLYRRACEGIDRRETLDY